MDLVVLKRDVVLEDGVPLLQDDLVPASARLSCDQLLKNRLRALVTASLRRRKEHLNKAT